MQRAAASSKLGGEVEAAKQPLHLPEPLEAENRRQYIAVFTARVRQLGNSIQQAQGSEVPVSHAKKLQQEIQAQLAAIETAEQLEGLLLSTRKSVSALKVQ